MARLLPEPMCCMLLELAPGIVEGSMQVLATYWSV
jgi:hypothetical protein